MNKQGCKVGEKKLTFTDGTDTCPGTIVLADSCGRTNKMVALRAGEVNLVSN